MDALILEAAEIVPMIVLTQKVLSEHVGVSLNELSWYSVTKVTKMSEHVGTVVQQCPIHHLQSHDNHMANPNY